MAERSEARHWQGRLSNFAPNLTEIEAKIKYIAERSEAEALALLLQIWTEIEAKIKHMAERSEVEALAFLLQIWTEIEAKIKHMADRSEAEALESDGRLKRK